MAAPEPGLDRHVWESQLRSLEDDLADDPEMGLPLLADMIERMLEERGLPPNDPVADDGIDPELLATFRAAREIADAVDADQEVDAEDVSTAIDNLRAVFDYLIAERGPP